MDGWTDGWHRDVILPFRILSEVLGGERIVVVGWFGWVWLEDYLLILGR